MDAAPLRAHSGVTASLGACDLLWDSGLLTNLSSLTHFLILRIPETAQAHPEEEYFSPETLVIDKSFGGGEGALCQSCVTREMGNWPGTLKTLPEC